MFNHSASVFLFLRILTILHGVYFTSCNTTISNLINPVELQIAEMAEFQTFFASLNLDAKKKYLLAEMLNSDHATEAIMIQEFRIQLSLKSPSKNSTELESKRIVPYGIEDYIFSEQDFIDSSKYINDVTTNRSENKVRYYLHTKKNPLNPDELFINNMDALTNSNFIRNARLKVLIQGYNSNVQTAIFPAILNASYLNSEMTDLNMILVDWSILSKAPNSLAVLHNVPIAAEEIAKFIKFLVDQNVTTLDQVHLVGHSFGAHLAGDTGFYINRLMGQKVPRVTGLDPMNPMFALAKERGRIDPSDGHFVDIIHTSGLVVGLLRSMGHADFYANGGLLQPGCSDHPEVLKKRVRAKTEYCLHDISYDYFSESILNPKGFKACKCNENILSGFSTCHCNGTDSTAYMGEYLSTTARGIYYLETNELPLYGKG